MDVTGRSGSGRDAVGGGLERRRMLAALGAAGLGAVLGACGGGRGGDEEASGVTTTTEPLEAGGGPPPSATPSGPAMFEGAGSCGITPELTEGPYYLDLDSVRGDIREDRQGSLLRLAIRVREQPSCAPVANAAVDVWHCDAAGLYSGFEAASTGGGGPGGGGPRGGGGRATDGKRYLRGTQITNAEGIVEFVTVYPGWYRGRTVHIHAKVHLGSQEVLTTQFYFDDDFTDSVYEAAAYVSDEGRDTFNADDGIYRDETLLTVTEDGDGYLGVINIDVMRG